MAANVAVRSAVAGAAIGSAQGSRDALRLAGSRSGDSDPSGAGWANLRARRAGPDDTMPTPAAFSLANGAWIFGAFVVVWLLAIAYGYYTRRGSAINQRSYGGVDAPGAQAPSVLSHDRSAARRLIMSARRRATATRKPSGEGSGRARARDGRGTRQRRA